jgi:filamentous hemagglutinin family protein
MVWAFGVFEVSAMKGSTRNTHPWSMQRLLGRHNTRATGTWLLGMAGVVSVCCGLPSAAIAQVIPDSTLGPDTSVVIDIDPSTQIIEGGATRGSNLFHSFLEFNIAPGSALYFNPDSDISDILTRITGPNPSAIDGLLGVNGSANLYLLNPNGIVFGPNASLDITGSFHAIAAPYLPLGNSIFSATAPQSSSLLSISPDVSLFNYLTSGDITSSAALSTGQALTLAGNNLQLSNQLQAGSDLTLLASDTVTIRDSADTAFLARSGDDLTVQGTNSIDILALQHLDLTPFVSGQDLTFISDGFISTDAHFESGGNLQFLTLSGAPGNLLSLYDPIISANGDVVFGDYGGVALKVEATGSIQGGNIIILGVDGTLTPDGSGSDEDLLASSRAAILRAGVTSVGSPNVPQSNVGILPPTNFVAPSGQVQPLGSIIVGSITTAAVFTRDAGPIILDAAGNIDVSGNLDSSSYSPVDPGDGGFIDLSAGDNINVVGNLDSSSISLARDSGSGGNISISSDNGNVSISGDIDSFSVGGEKSGDGGNISVLSGREIEISGGLTSYSLSSSLAENGGNGGDISLFSNGGDINVLGGFISSSLSVPGNAGNSGDILLSSSSGNINVSGNFLSYSNASGNPGNGGEIELISEDGHIFIDGQLDSRSYSYGSGAISQNGGEISLLSNRGGIEIVGNIDSSSLGVSSSGNGGNILLASQVGNIRISGNLDSYSYGAINASRDGGNIALTSDGGDITVLGGIRSNSSLDPRLSAQSSYAGNGGEITLTAIRGGINIFGNLSSYSRAPSTSGDGGNINLYADEFIDLLNSIYSYSYSYSNGVVNIGDSGNGGNISLSSNSGIRGNRGNAAVLTFSVTEGNSTQNSGQGGNVTFQASGFISDFELWTLSSDGISGDVNIQGVRDLQIRDVGITSSGQVTFPGPFGRDITLDTTGFGQSGNVTLTSASDLTLDNVEIRSDANGRVPGGRILVENADAVILNSSELLSDTNADGIGGDIILRNLGSLTFNNSTTTTDTAGATPASDAGDIQIQDVGIFQMRNGSLVLVAADNGANAGDININTDFVIAPPNENNDIIANAVGGNGGRITATATGIYGFDERNGFTVAQLRGFSTNDFSASSVFARNGEVNLTFEESPSLEELPSDFLDSDSLISNSCITPDNQIGGNFTIPGAGGLPYTPEEATNSTYPTGEVQTLPTPQSNADDDGWQLGDPIVEPDAVTQLADGRIVFGRRCEQP